MSQNSEYERLQIHSLLQPRNRAIQANLGVFLMPTGLEFQRVYERAVGPAMQSNRLNPSGVEVAFDSGSSLAQVCEVIETAEILVADLSLWNADLAYVLGVCHGMGRCPLLIAKEGVELPFNLSALRCVEYSASDEGLQRHREYLERAIRVSLAAARVGTDG